MIRDWMDAIREARIELATQRMLDAGCAADRRRWAEVQRRLIARRSPAQVARMEKQRGFR